MTTRSKTKKRRQQRSAARRKAKLAPPAPRPPSEFDVWLKEWAEASGFADAWRESDRLNHPGPYEAWFDTYHGEP